jgi:hypothetical protein
MAASASTPTTTPAMMGAIGVGFGIYSQWDKLRGRTGEGGGRTVVVKVGNAVGWVVGVAVMADPR